RLRTLRYRLPNGTRRIDQQSERGRRRNQFVQKFQGLWYHLIAQIGHACEIAARSVQTRDEAGFDWIDTSLDDDWYARRSGLGCLSCSKITGRGDDGHLTTGQIVGQIRQLIESAFRPAIFDDNVPPLDVPSFAQASTKCVETIRVLLR